MINAPNRAAFVATYGHLFEHSPWVVERAWHARPFADFAALHSALIQVLSDATPAEQLGLIRAHPELGAQMALTTDSKSEQSGAGLKNLDAGEGKTFSALNAGYQEKFDFPFIICVRRHNKASILTVFAQRLQNDAAAEHSQALREIGNIAWERLHDMKAEAAA